VIAVPTSVGYGAAFQGLAAMLGMLTSCASNVTVVNIDNGFGAGYAASGINALAAASSSASSASTEVVADSSAKKGSGKAPRRR
jgi:hypothetical protein